MIRLIVACDAQGGIAKNGTLPWDIPNDRAYFKQKTTQHGASILMGRKTYETIGHPLVGRTNYVASRHLQSQLGVHIVPDVLKFLAAAPGDFWIIGGADIYAITMPLSLEIYVTRIEADFKCDTFFPALNNFNVIRRSQMFKQDSLAYSFLVYDRATCAVTET